MSNAADRLFAFVLENAGNEPAGKRALLYRDTAEILSRPDYAESLLKLASELEEIEAKHDQLLFDFRRKHSAGPGATS